MDGDATATRARSRPLARLAVPIAALVLGLLAVGIVLAVRPDVDSAAAGVSPSRLVNDPDDVVGRWQVVEVEGGPVPADAIRWLVVSLNGEDGLSLLTSDGVNSTDTQVRLDDDGSLADSRAISSLMGCQGPDGTYESCTRPSGFGVDEAEQLRLTPDGDLVLVGEGDAALAMYRRAR